MIFKIGFAVLIATMLIVAGVSLIVKSILN